MSSIRSLALALLVAASTLACGESTGPDANDVLAGLVAAAPHDSAGGSVTPPTGTGGSGYFRGYVRGPNAPGTGGDTLATSPRIAGVVVRAYPIVGGSSSGPELGALAGEVTTNAQGAFTFPTIAAGEYVVTFRPPANSGYQGIWVYGPIHSTSHEFAWWVTLPRL